MKVAAFVAAYIGAAVLANLSVAAFGPAYAIVNAFLLIGLDLTARDTLHEAWRGRGLGVRMAALIFSGSVISYALNAGAGRIALASFVSFALSGATDAGVYALLDSRPFRVKSNGSNLASAAVDSLCFPTIAFGVFMPWLIAGQFAAKFLGGALWVEALARFSKSKAQ